MSRRASCRSCTESCAITSARASVSGLGATARGRSSWTRGVCATLRSFTGFCAVAFCSGARTGRRGAAGRGGNADGDVGGRVATAGGDGAASGGVGAGVGSAVAGADAVGGTETAGESSAGRAGGGVGIDTTGGVETARESSAGRAGGAGADATGRLEAIRGS
jgi:hypothetical protein